MGISRLTIASDAPRQRFLFGAAVLASTAALVAVFMLHAVFATYVQPQADDWCTNFRILEDGFWPLQAARRNGITGLYTGMALQGLVSLSAALTGAVAAPFQAAVLLYVMAVPLSVFILLRNGLPRLSAPLSVTAALAFFAVWALTIPTPYETLFWVASATLHLTGPILFILALAVLVRLHAGSLGWIVPAAALCVLIPGASWSANLSSFGLLVLLILSVWAGWLPRPRWGLWPYAALSALAGAATLFTMTAPGNAKRIAFETGAGQLLWSLSSAAAGFGSFAAACLGEPMVWLAALLGSALVVLDGGGAVRIRGPLLALAAAGLFAMGFTVAFLSYYGAGQLAGRTLGGMAVIWLFGMIAIAATAAPRLPWLGPLLAGRPRDVLALSALALAVLALTKDRSHHMLQELEGPAALYRTENETRYARLRGAESGPVEVPPLTSRPSTLLVTDLSPDRTHWTNRCQARYFKVEALCLTGTCPAHP